MQNPQGEFVRFSDGSLDFGRITPEQALALPDGLGPGEIRLAKGDQDPVDSSKGYGETHVEFRHGDEIRRIKDANGDYYPDAAAFVADVAENYDQIRDGNKEGRLLLVKFNGKAKQLVVELNRDGDYYDVVSAAAYRRSFFKNEGNLLWSRARVASQPSADAEPLRRWGQSSKENDTTTPSGSGEKTSFALADQAPRREGGDIAGGDGAVMPESGWQLPELVDLAQRGLSPRVRGNRR